LGQGNTLPPAKVDILSGLPTEVTLCNISKTPTLKISKSNDASGDKFPGENVAYTIIVTVNDADANDVIVTDLLPEGFTYNSGSWTVDLNGNPLSIAEPTYHSPGVWYLGNALKDDVFTLKYTARIDGSVQPGTYRDVAWAQGTSLASGTVLALAVDPGIVDTNFVGTQVTIPVGNNNGPTYNIDITKTQEVLGASIYLPATGENTLLVITAVLMLISGTGALIIGLKSKKKYVK
jgi:uncharacterized repeat protein (TIGR01451 family)/LPXTG-motif cell wall-anchored protein